MNKRFAIIVDGGKFYLADKRSPIRQEMEAGTVGGKVAWISTTNKRALIPCDQVLGYFAMSVHEFDKLEEGAAVLMAREEFTCTDARIAPL